MIRLKPIVAIDGPVGVGKSTVARTCADDLGFLYIDTGAMYRAITYKAMQNNIALNDPHHLADLANQTQLHFERHEDGLHIFCDRKDISEEIRLPEVSANTTFVADNVMVRQRLVALQQEMGHAGGVVMEGRDIGSVVFPDAEIKIYLDGDPKIRAQRRYEELKNKGKNVTFEDTLEQLVQRDHRDKTRDVGALVVTEDAHIIDTSHMTQEQVVHKIVLMVQSYMNRNL